MCPKLKILSVGIKSSKLDNKGPLISTSRLYNQLKHHANIDLLPSLSLNFKSMKNFATYFKRAIFSKYYDIIHFNTLPLFYDLSSLLVFSSSKKVLNLHGVIQEEKKFFKEFNLVKYLLSYLSTLFIVKNCDLVVVNSKFVYGRIKKYYHLKNNRLLVIPHGIEKKKHLRFTKLKGHPSMVFCGWLTYYKGFDLIIKSLAYLKRIFPNIHLHVIGNFRDNTFKSEITYLINRNDLAKYITFYGRLPASKVYRYYSGADLCLFPSRYESFGLVNFEAMSQGSPIIASKLSGVSEYLKNKKDAIIIYPSVKEIKKAVIFLAKNKEASKKLSKEGLKLVRNYYWAAISKIYLKSFNNLFRRE